MENPEYSKVIIEKIIVQPLENILIISGLFHYLLDFINSNSSILIFDQIILKFKKLKSINIL